MSSDAILRERKQLFLQEERERLRRQQDALAQATDEQLERALIEQTYEREKLGGAETHLARRIRSILTCTDVDPMG